jgi:phosphatidate cytidylyltransferase
MVYVVVPLSALLWLFAASLAVLRGRTAAPAAHWGWTWFAPLALLATWTVLTLFFMMHGAVFVLSLLTLVWVADSAAYFVGRVWGRRKLAPHVSPGKTVEGALAGIAAAMMWIAVSSRWQGTFGDLLVVRWSLWGALLMAAGLAILAIMGDLFESLLKRRAGYKNSSTLLPGHGGVYDRIDAILPVAPWAFMLSGAVC